MASQELLDAARSSPKESGRLELIVARLPDQEGRRPLERARLTPEGGLEGDRWGLRPGGDPAKQVSLINSRFLAAIAAQDARRPLAGDNLVVDIDLGVENLPAGARLEVGEALLEVSAHPHTGCSRFQRRYGREANELTATPEGKAQRLRGVYARVVRGGLVRVGDPVRKAA